ncbi:MAG: Lrp/AsnC ligand binding domain-containing protein [Candidatus Bathyarchaeia archaeon]
MLNACILLKVVPTKADAIISSVKQFAWLRKAYSTFGRFDVVIFVEAKDYAELRRVTGEINGLDGVRSTETLPEA